MFESCVLRNSQKVGGVKASRLGAFVWHLFAALSTHADLLGGMHCYCEDAGLCSYVGGHVLVSLGALSSKIVVRAVVVLCGLFAPA
jgi:hypothetical protein